MTMSHWHVVLPMLLLCLMAAVVAVSSAQEEGGGNGRSGSSVSSRRNRAEGQEGRRTRATRNKDLNEVNKPRQRKKDRKVNIGTLELVVREALQQQLEPLNTALRLVKLDTFTENVHRQLSTLEHIQSKLLTEYGELKASVAEIGRNTNDIGRAVNTLEQKMTMLERSIMTHSKPKEPPPRQPSEPSTQSDTSSFTQQLQEAVTSVTTKLQATERRFKDNLATLENRTTDAIRKSHQDLERRLSMNGLDNVLIMHSLDKLVNKSCGKSPPVSSHVGRSIPGDSPQPRRGRHDTHMEKTQQEDELAYFPVDPKDQRIQRIRSESGSERLRSWLIRETGRPVSEVNTFSLGMVTRLASEIARQIQEDSRPETLYPRDCSDISAAGETESGVYTIYPASCTARFSVQVWCEMSGSGQAGWTVIQRRGSQTDKTPHPVVDFFRDWAEYKWGFGSLDGEYWLGNEYLHQLTQSGDYELRVDLQDWSNETRFAIYRHVSLDTEPRNYTLYLGDYEGTAGNSLKYHQGAAFSTRDRDNDLNPQGHCARTFHGAWWFTACHESHLNGRYHHGRHKSYGDGINWMAFRGHNYSLKFCRMMIRPVKQT